MATRQTRRFSKLLGFASLFVAGTALADGLTAEKLIGLARLSEPVVSPNGKYIAYTLSETLSDENRRQRDIWMLSIESGSAPARMTNASANESNPQFSQDGKWLYFLSDRSGSSQVWRLPLDIGDPQPVTNYEIDIHGFRLTPNNRFLIFGAQLDTSCGLDFACSAKSHEQDNNIRTYSRLMVRHWDTWRDNTIATLLSQPLSDTGLPTGDVIGLSNSIDAAVPVPPFGSIADVAISPDSSRVVFAARVESDSVAWSTNTDLYQVSPSGGRVRNLTAANEATDSSPTFSADGTLYYLAMERPGYEADRQQIMRLRGSKPEAMAPNWDRSVSALVVGDQERLYAVANDMGRRRVFEVENGLATPITAFGFVNSVRVLGDDLLISLDTLHQPADLYRVDGNDSALYRLTRVNAQQLAGTQMGVYEQFEFAGWNDELVRGFIMKPIGFRPERSYPLAFLIHGGPQGSFSDHFHYRWNPQFYAALGYAVVMIDFHGSTGYGQAFTDSIRGDWGGKPLVDLQLGLAKVTELYPFIDGERVCALGASYGGYMVNWIAGNWPDRFRCLVNHDGIFDNRMLYYTTEELWFPEWEHGGPAYAESSTITKHNPVDHVDKWRTPMLVIHGAKDYRVVGTQGIATFTALQRRGIDSQLLWFDAENHWVLSPTGSVHWHDTVKAWLAEYLDR